MKQSMQFWNAFGIALCTLAPPSPTCAQIVPDATLPVNSNVTADGNTNIITGGTAAGSNLFHSFERFSIPTGGAAYFNNALDIQNIISRVTGSSISNIDGLLRANGTANLFLLNPNGIIFGPNASLNIGGSFLGSTASSLNLADGIQFSATAPQSAPLLTVSVPLGLQYGGTSPGSIRNLSQVTNSSGETVGLQVQPGKTLALVGGDVNLDGGNLFARGGRVELGGVSGAGTVGLFVDSNNLFLSFPDDVPRADVYLTNSGSNTVLVNVAAGNGGSIAINARNIDISGNSVLRGGLETNSGFLGATAGDITLNATEGIAIANGGGIGNIVRTGAVGNGGGVNITTGSLSLTNGAQLRADTFGQGDAGSVNIQARHSVSLINSNSSVRSAVLENGVGNGGDIIIQTGSLSLSDNAQLATSALGKGNAGNIRVNASESVSVKSGSILQAASLSGQGNAGSVTIEGRDGVLPVVLFDGMGADGSPAAVLTSVSSLPGVVSTGGKGGDLNITARSLSLTNGAQLSTFTFGQNLGQDAGNIQVKVSDSLTVSGGSSLDSFTAGQGNAGNVNIDAGNATLVFDGVGSNGVSSGVASFVAGEPQLQLVGIGKGGDITIRARSLSLRDGAQIDASTFSQGDAGSIFVQANDAISLAGNGTTISSNVESGAFGNAGDIDVRARSLSVTDGAALSSSTNGQGDAGNVSINASDTVTVAGMISSGIASVVGERGRGNGGDISITTGSLSLTNGGQLRADTFGQGNAGNVSINASDTVTVAGVNSSSGFNSGVFSAVQSESVGKGGNINVRARSLSVTDGAALSSSTNGQGDAGNVSINASDTVTVAGMNSSSGFNSVIGSAVGPRGRGNGGDISITTGSLSVTNGAGLTASNEGSGAAGNIEVAANSIRLENQAVISSDTTGGQGNIILHSGDLVLRRGSNITTDATGTATGGNITIDADVIVALENSDISAKASEGPGGRIIINATGIFGTQFREAETEESDITASSNLGPQFSGTVEINTPGIDPSIGLVTLPANLVDTSGLIATGCADSEENKFIITGRGGLPPNPGDSLIGEAVITNWATLDPEVENRSGADTTNPTRENAPTQIVEAQGWVMNNKGEIVLTAHAPNVTLNIPWLTPTTCHASETES